ncbi:hypothetical protein JGI20_00595 [Candidatus Kryptobacter tengchongensis]|nr:hypothetical protein JGI20_00595 [Candidatus Kryptobacter tengchongensis]
MRRVITILILFTVVLTLTSMAKEKNSERSKIATFLKSSGIVLEKFDGNRISSDVENTGQYVSYHRTGDAGLEWPKGSHMTADFAAGVWVAGKVRGTGELRTAAAEYQVEFEPGKILPNGQPDDPNKPGYKIWKINKTDLFNPGDDYLNWPVEDGAPWEDVDGDGVFTRGVDRPLLMGDQTLWMVFNDANPAAHNIFKTQPMGLEVQMTIWGYNRVDAFGDMMFVKCVIINKSNNTYDSTFVALWDDPDLGYAGDDFVGCDTTLSLGYCYNASNTDNVYGSAPPAIGRDFFQGVKVYTGDPNDSAKAFGRWWKGYKNLPMYAFTFYWNGAPFPYRDPEFADEAYNFMKGFLADGTPYVDPNTNQATRFVFPGDPETRTGWLDGTRVGPTTLAPGDRRFLMSNGPFTLAPGDTQEIVFGLLIARGSSNVNSVTVLKLIDRQAQIAYDIDFKLPPTPPFPNVQVAELDREIVLYWPYDPRIDEYSEIDLIDVDEQGRPTRYNFEGFIVYQFDSPTQPTKWTRIAVFDVINDVKEIKDWVFDPVRGENIEVTVVKGTDSGIERTIRIKKDYLNDKPLVNGRPYYFAVTAYAYNPYGVPRFYESARNIITVIPRPVSPGVRYTSAVGDTVQAVHKQGVSDGEVFGIVVDPTKLTGHKYEVRFEEVGGEITWKLVDVTANQVKLSGQTNQSGDGNYTVVDGIQFKVVGPPAGPKGWAWTKGTRKLTWANADIMTSFGLPEHLFTFNGAFGYVSPYGIFISGHEHSDVVTPDKLRNIRILFADTDTDGNITGAPENASFGYRYLRRANAVPAKPEFAPFIKNPAGGYAFQEFGLNGQKNVPLAVYDIEANPPRRLAVGFLENNVVNGLVDGKYWPGDYNVYDNIGSSGPREWLFIFDVDYSETQDNNLANDILSYDLPVMYMATWNRRGNVAFSSGDELEIYANHPNTVNDVFEITAPSAPTYSVETAKSDLEKVNAFPNPYFGASPLEKEITEAFITFTRLPNKCTIRIFTVAGDLIRTIQKDDDSPYARWDLRNEAGVPVASGIYIVHVDVPGVGSKILKVVVFQREERLRYF